MIFRYLPLGASILIFGLAFSNVVVAQMDFSFPDEKVPVLKVEEYYDEANKEKRPMLLVYPDGRVVRPVSVLETCLLYTSPSPRDGLLSRMPSSA